MEQHGDFHVTHNEFDEFSADRLFNSLVSRAGLSDEGGFSDFEPLGGVFRFGTWKYLDRKHDMTEYSIAMFDLDALPRVARYALASASPWLRFAAWEWFRDEIKMKTEWARRYKF
eukprot:5837481-Prymnesium_polylepis.1